MTPRGQHVCRYLVCDPGEEIPQNDWAPNWHNMGHKVGANAQVPYPLDFLSLSTSESKRRLVGGCAPQHVGAKVDNPFADGSAKM